MPTPRPPTLDKYQKKSFGFAGRFGDGQNVVVRFIQTGISSQQLDDIKLIQDIPGSEKWDVKDLFQRSVDMNRVKKEIKPYLKNENLVKFFNPLTLILLPFDDNNHPSTSIDFVETTIQEVEDIKYTTIEKDGFYRYCEHPDHNAYSRVEWNSDKTKLVAIDGQHRLATLKSIKEEGEQNLIEDWTIPAVLLVLCKVDEDKTCPSLLDVVRSAFMFINTKAETVNPARTILLDDSSVTAVCTQQIIQSAHTNDNQDNPDLTRLPLMFYDWRGDSDPKSQMPTALLNVVEVRNLLEHYIIGDRPSDQKVSLGIATKIPPIEAFEIADNRDTVNLNHEETAIVRDVFDENILPAFNHLMDNFNPFANYSKKMRKQYREEFEKDPTHARYAYEKLMFGHSSERPMDVEAVELILKEIVQELREHKGELPALLQQDIGRRGIFAACGMLKRIRDEYQGATSNWLDHMEWFVKKINKVARTDYFGDYDSLPNCATKTHLKHIVHNGSNIVNYRFDAVKKAYGPLLSLCVTETEGKGLKRAVWDEASDLMEVPLRAGFLRECKQDEGLIAKFTGTQDEITAKMKREAGNRVEKRIKLLKSHFDITDD